MSDRVKVGDYIVVKSAINNLETRNYTDPDHGYLEFGEVIQITASGSFKVQYPDTKCHAPRQPRYLQPSEVITLDEFDEKITRITTNSFKLRSCSRDDQGEEKTMKQFTCDKGMWMWM